MSVYGETIYGTRRGPISPNDSIVSTQKDGVVFLHLLNVKGEKIELNNFNAKIKTLYNFISKEKIPYKVKGETLTIDLKNQIKDPVNTVLVLKIR